MQKIQKINSQVAPLPIKDVDTDLIIPAQYLTSISREGFGQNCFRRLRDTDPNFALNQTKYTGSKILAADSNFGCGSSREHAVWALQGAGFEAVISKSFADIFYNNSAKNSLLLVTLPEAAVDKMLKDSASEPVYKVEIDLAEQTVSLPDGSKVKFEFDPFRKYCLLNGLDDIEYIRSHAEDVKEFRKRQVAAGFCPTTT